MQAEGSIRNHLSQVTWKTLLSRSCTGTGPDSSPEKLKFLISSPPSSYNPIAYVWACAQGNLAFQVQPPALPSSGARGAFPTEPVQRGGYGKGSSPPAFDSLAYSYHLYYIIKNVGRAIFIPQKLKKSLTFSFFSLPFCSWQSDI